MSDIRAIEQTYGLDNYLYGPVLLLLLGAGAGQVMYLMFCTLNGVNDKRGFYTIHVALFYGAGEGVVCARARIYITCMDIITTCKGCFEPGFYPWVISDL